MSPLWWSRKIKQLITKHMRPSPKQNSDYQTFAQSLQFCHHRQIPQCKSNCNALEGISLFISLSKRLQASMTVEAAIVLPLFLFFFLNLGCAIEMIRLHGNLELALCDIGNRMSVYGYALTEPSQEQPEDADGLWGELKDVAFSYSYVKNEIIKYLGEQYLEESPLADGSAGLHFIESEIFNGQDCFEIIATYEVAPFSGIAGFGSFRMANKYYGHLWNGYRIPGTENKSEKVEEIYVAENGIVYHDDENCSHLLLSVREVSLQEAYERRNVDGRRYTPCMRCEDSGLSGNVYITDEGDNIHYRRDCGGLKRTVYVLSKDAVGEYRACSRCVQD